MVEEAGFATFAVLDEDPEAADDLHGAELIDTVQTSVVGIPLYLHSYEL